MFYFVLCFSPINPKNRWFSPEENHRLSGKNIIDESAILVNVFTFKLNVN